MVLVDLPAFGRPVRLVWHKRRWRCARDGCEAGSVTEQAAEIAPPRALLTSRAARWATRQAGRGRPLKDVAAELGCVWHTVNTAVKRWGQALLAADTARISDVEALGLDETLFWRRGRFRAKTWGTSIVDVGRGQLLDIVRGRDAKAPTRWLLRRRREWRDGDPLGGAGASRAPTAPRSTPPVPKARQVADPFHVVRLGNDALDEVRRRVQNQTLGHRGRKDDPLYRARKLLVSASENITEHGHTKLRGLLDAGGPLRRGPRRLATPKRPCGPSMTSAAPKSAPPPSPSSPPTSKNRACPKRSTGSAAPSPPGEPKSPTGTPPESPTPPPRQPTT